MDDNVRDITVEILKSIRDEIRLLREDTNSRFEQMDKRFERMDERFGRIEADLRAMRADIKSIVVHFDRDFMLMATEVEGIKSRLGRCEEKLALA